MWGGEGLQSVEKLSHHLTTQKSKESNPDEILQKMCHHHKPHTMAWKDLVEHKCYVCMSYLYLNLVSLKIHGRNGSMC